MAPAETMIFAGRIAERGMKETAGILLNIWIYFNLVGNNILLPIVVFTFLFSNRAKRHPTLVNLCITWIFSGVFSLLLYYSNQHVGPVPDVSLCVAQASLLYGITPMWSVAVLALVHYMLHSIRGYSPQSSSLHSFQMVLLLGSPYVAQCSFTIAALILSVENPTKVNRRRDSPVCSLRHVPLFFAMSIFTSLICVIIMVLEVALVVVIYRNWRTRQSAGLPSHLPAPLVARVLVFGIYVALGMAVSVLAMFGYRTSADIFAATAGTVVFLIFGTQADVFRAWCFWRKYEDTPPNSPLLPTKSLADQSPTALDSIFRSPRSSKSSKKFPWSDRYSRPISIPSTRRSSTKQFVRLPEDELYHNFPVRDSLTRQAIVGQHINVQGEQGVAQGAQISPKRARSGDWRTGQGRTTVAGGVRKPENVKRRRRPDLPRPKGPRKAGTSSAITMPAADSLITRPAAVALRPLPLISVSNDSSRTLSTGSTSSSFS